MGSAENLLQKGHLHKSLKGKVQLIFTSPPFPLNNKKKYGNLQGEDFKNWFSKLGPILSELLSPDGSIVVEMGNAWEPGRPVQSLLHLESLLSFLREADLRLCQEFICYNPARLPSPAQWVTVNRYRVVDSFSRLWWMSRTDFPKADNRKVLRPYSKSMLKLLQRRKYNAGLRPSEHRIGESSFLTDHGGSIMSNLIELDPIDPRKGTRLPESVFRMANTNSSDFFLSTCRGRQIVPHPARMPLELPTFFIEFLTDLDDMVLDPFAGSNTTGFCAEKLKRKWISIDISHEYASQSKIRFEDPILHA